MEDTHHTIIREQCGVLNFTGVAYGNTNIANPHNIESVRQGEKLVTFSKAETATAPLCQAHTCGFLLLHISMLRRLCLTYLTFAYSSPISLYHSVSNTTDHIFDIHAKWLELIRTDKKVLRADSEAQNVPTVEALVSLV